jgi:hypothetical protein
VVWFQAFSASAQRQKVMVCYQKMEHPVGEAALLHAARKAALAVAPSRM